MSFLEVISVVIILAAAISGFALIRGDNRWNRLLGYNIVSGKVAILIVLWAAITDNFFYLDIAIVYVLLSFIGVTALSDYLVDSSNRGRAAQREALAFEEVSADELGEFPWNYWVGNALVLLGAIALIFGVVGVLRFKRFTMKVLASTKIDTVAFMFILIGLAVRSGLTWFSAKAILLLVIIIYVTPIGSGQTLSRARQDGEA